MARYGGKICLLPEQWEDQESRDELRNLLRYQAKITAEHHHLNMDESTYKVIERQPHDEVEEDAKGEKIISHVATMIWTAEFREDVDGPQSG